MPIKPFDSKGAFRPSVPDGGNKLRRLAVQGAGATLFSGGVALGIQVFATMVLARILTPRDFGLVAMVTTFSLVLSNFGFNGLTEAIVQREEVDHALASTLFWINLAGGIVLTLLFAAAGSLLARFYHAPVRDITIGVSLSIVATSISVVHLALLKRAMLFSQVSVNDIVARLVSVVTSIALGLAGWGYWALVVGAIALPLSASIGAFILCPWMPGLPRRAKGTGSALKFAVNTYGNFCINYFSRNTDNLLVGWKFNAQSLGFYKKAYDLFALSAGQLVSSLTVVVVATLSRAKPNSDQYRRYLLTALSVMTLIGMGLAAALTVVGKDLIRVLLGPRWDPAGQIFTFFAPGIGIMILYATHGWIHLSIGRADRWLRWAVIEFLVTLGLFLIGLHWGPVGIAMAWTVSFWVLTIPAIWYAGKPIGFGVTPVILAVWRYILASFAASVVAGFFLHLTPHLNSMGGAIGAFYRLLAGSLLVTIIYLGTVVVLHGGFEPVQQIIRLAREMLPGRFGAAASSESVDELPLPLTGDWSGRPRPLVSILIPAHNSETWIAETLRSALAQTWEPKEIIVVDDGSTDRTLAIAKEFEPYGVRVVWQENQGASAARNNAFSLSKGEYIQWLDADDLLAPDKISLQMELAQNLSRRLLISGPWGRFMYRPYRAEFVPSSLWCDLTPTEWLVRKMEQNVFMQTATWLVSRELTEAAGPWDIRLLGDDDGEYFCRVLLASDGVRFVRGANLYYRAFRFNSLSYIGRFPRKIEAHWLSMQLHIQYLRSLEDSVRVRSACLEYLRSSLIYFYPEHTHIIAQAEQLAQQFDQGLLGEPYLSWKYIWVEKLFGWAAAKRVQSSARKVRWSFEKHFDRLLFSLEKQKSKAAGNIPQAVQQQEKQQEEEPGVTVGQLGS